MPTFKKVKVCNLPETDWGEGVLNGQVRGALCVKVREGGKGEGEGTDGLREGGEKVLNLQLKK